MHCIIQLNAMTDAYINDVCLKLASTYNYDEISFSKTHLLSNVEFIAVTGGVGISRHQKYVRRNIRMRISRHSCVANDSFRL